MLKIPAHDFKKIFEVICREFPSAYTSLGDLDAKEEYLSKNNVVLLDDFSNTVGASNNFARDNAETAIRAVGDGMFSGKMNITNLAEGRADDVQCVIVITGEDELGLSESSLYRLIVLPIVEGTFDTQVLAHISNRHEILREYFALFVQFLTECGFNVVCECASRFAEYREFYRQKFSVPRFIDAIATMAGSRRSRQ